MKGTLLLPFTAGLLLIGMIAGSGCLGTGTLQVSSVPAGADVYSDGVYEGTTNIQLEKDTGSYTLRLVKSGYNDYETTVSVTEGETATVNAILSPVTSVSLPKSWHLVREESVTVPRDCYIFYRYSISPYQTVKMNVNAATSLEAFTMSRQNFDLYVDNINNYWTYWNHGFGYTQDQYGKQFEIFHEAISGNDQPVTWYFVIDNTPMGKESSGTGPAHVRITSDDPDLI